jgi:hypothetical protein
MSKFYIPSILIQKKKRPKLCTWSISNKMKNGNYLMTMGPFHSEIECLECVGDRESKIPGAVGEYIVLLQTNGKKYATWKWKDRKWIKIKDKQIS